MRWATLLFWNTLLTQSFNLHVFLFMYMKEERRCPIVARVNAKTMYTIRHVYLTAVTVLLMLQTQRFILTVSLPADL